MTTQQQEEYAFHHLSLIDMQRTWESLDARRHMKKKASKDALFRDAIVCYSCPFKTNRGVFGKLKLDLGLVPDSMRDIHDEVIALRDQIVAHNDLREQNLQFGAGKGFTVNGYETIHREDLVNPLRSLSQKIHSAIMRKMSDLEAGV